MRSLCVVLLVSASLLAAGPASAQVACDIGPTYMGSLPADAQAAGFTKCAANYDFTQPFYATASNWLDCAGATTPQWFQGYIAVEYALHVPCSYIGQIPNDPAFPDGGPVLSIFWDDSQYVGYPGTTGTSIETTDAGGNRGPYYTFFYEEIIARMAILSPTNYYSLWSVGQDGQSIELDGLEVAWGGVDSDSCYHNNRTGAVLCIWIATNPPSGPIDFTQYHKWAWRVTSDGVTDVQWCVYIDDVLQGCLSVFPTAGQVRGDSTIATAPQLFVTDRASACPGGHPPCGITGQMYVKSVRVWTCPAWSQANPLAHCYSSSPDP